MHAELRIEQWSQSLGWGRGRFRVRGRFRARGKLWVSVTVRGRFRVRGKVRDRVRRISKILSRIEPRDGLI